MRASIMLGLVSLPSAIAFYFLTQYTSSLPYGNNDLDLSLAGLALVDIVLFAWTAVLAPMGLVLNLANTLQRGVLWLSAIGIFVNLMALTIVGFAIMS